MMGQYKRRKTQMYDTTWMSLQGMMNRRQRHIINGIHNTELYTQNNRVIMSSYVFDFNTKWGELLILEKEAYMQTINERKI